MSVPRGVRLAFYYGIAAMIVSLVATGLITFLVLPELTDSVLGALRPRAQLRLGPSARATVHLVWLLQVIGAVVQYAVLMFLLLRMRAGAHWARVLLTVAGVFAAFGATSAAVALPVLTGVQGWALPSSFWVSGAVILLAALLVLASVLSMYRPGAQAYFRRETT